MTQLDDMVARAAKNPKHIVLAEGADPRIIEAAVKATQDKIAQITLLGTSKDIRPLTRAAGDTEDLITIHELEKAAPLSLANAMVKDGRVDGCIAGAVFTTPNVVRAALKGVGVDPNYKLVSSFFIMLLPSDGENLQGGVIYSDCGLVINPDAEQLADIASAAGQNAKMLLGLEPKIAMLSFATYQSASHAMVDKVTIATKLLNRKYPNLAIDGPLQFDAAIIPEISQSKAPGSAVAGKANVFIFPDLNSGNIGYKITERIGGAKAIGPILQGLTKPSNDLSRGCSAEDVYNMIVVTVLQAQASSVKQSEKS